MSAKHPKGTRLAMEKAAAEAAAKTAPKSTSTNKSPVFNKPGSGSTGTVERSASDYQEDEPVTTTNSGGKSGKTLAARADAEFWASIKKYVVVGGLLVAGFMVIRKLKIIPGLKS